LPSLGAVDDWEGIHGKRKGDGMRARTKFAVQVILALATAYTLKYVIDAPDLYLPGYFFEVEIGWMVRADCRIHHCCRIECR
jgi:phospho-N-acetylmuramoyl-pentapeptide-transferase